MTEELKQRLDRAAPTRLDWVLYCPTCGWVGERNAAYAAAWLANHDGCAKPLRLWRGEGAPHGPGRFSERPRAKKARKKA